MKVIDLGSCSEFKPFEEPSDTIRYFILCFQEVHFLVSWKIVSECEEIFVISIGWCAYRTRITIDPADTRCSRAQWLRLEADAVHLSFDAVVATLEVIYDFVSFPYEQFSQPFDIDVSECAMHFL